MAFTQQQLNALEDAYAQGATKVKWPGGEVEYRTLDEMQRIIREMRKSLNQSTSDGGNGYPVYRSGL
ncbi:MAG: hypothetical protein COA70_02045 [Planctomycetota bacterium]|nr:MAG: hypothetical protein COA70_02045 [Planctomycetota bacterium]